MDRTSFLNSLIEKEVASEAGIDLLDKATPHLREYSNIVYKNHYNPRFARYYHSLEVKKGDTTHISHIETDEKTLGLEYYEAMMHDLIKAKLLP